MTHPALQRPPQATGFAPLPNRAAGQPRETHSQLRHVLLAPYFIWFSLLFLA